MLQSVCGKESVLTELLNNYWGGANLVTIPFSQEYRAQEELNIVSISFANSRQERILLLTYLKLHRKHFTFLTLLHISQVVGGLFIKIMENKFSKIRQRFHVLVVRVKTSFEFIPMPLSAYLVESW